MTKEEYEWDADYDRDDVVYCPEDPRNSGEELNFKMTLLGKIFLFKGINKDYRKVLGALLHLKIGESFTMTGTDGKQRTYQRTQ